MGVWSGKRTLKREPKMIVEKLAADVIGELHLITVNVC